MNKISDFNSILNWKLLSGSHDFPGADGGTCINEAALVVAGFEYRKVGSASDLPACFSRPISAYSIRLNDRMPDDIRQELLTPFVVRLAGSADTPEIECKRSCLIVLRTVTDILPIILDARGHHDLAAECRECKTPAEASAAARRARDEMRAAAANAAAARSVWVEATAILDAALRIGRQAEPIEIAAVVARAEQAKRACHV